MTFEEELRQACFDLCDNLMWENESLTSEKVESHIEELSQTTDGFIEIAKHYLEYIIRMNGDKYTLIRAIRYMDQVHAMPPLRGNINWFDFTLQTLLELINPNSEIKKEHITFMSELENGISAQKNSVDE